MNVPENFHPKLREGIRTWPGWSGLRPVQLIASEAILSGSNTVIVAPTGGGKTEAALFPLVSSLLDAGKTGVGVVYLCPQRTWLDALDPRVGAYTSLLGLRHFVWHGAVDEPARQGFLRDPAEVLMVTPESLEVMLISRRVPTEELFRSLQAVIVDEAHALAGTDRGAHLLGVIERVVHLAGRDIQRVALCTPVGNPADIVAWLQGSSARPSEVVDPPRPRGRKALAAIARGSLPALVADAAAVGAGHKCLVYAQARKHADAIADRLRAAGGMVLLLPTGIPERARAQAEETFAQSDHGVLVCAGARDLGLDVQDIECVLQVNAPGTVGTFLQRLGRTGRRPGTTENTTFLCDSPEAVLLVVALVDLARRAWIEPVRLRRRCWQALVHQVMAVAIERPGIPPDALWAELMAVSDFRGIRREEFDRVIEHFVRTDHLVATETGLALGAAGDRAFGRRNFMELYAVFRSPGGFTVATSQGAELGTLDPDFVDILVAGVSVFALAGKVWCVDEVRWRERTVQVSPASEDPSVTWGGSVPQVLGRVLCQRMRGLLASDVPVPYLHSSAQDALEGLRAEHQGRVERTPRGDRTVSETATWWTWAGGRINHTLALVISVRTGWTVVPDNFALRLEGGATLEKLFPLIEAMRSRDFWHDEALWTGIEARVGAWRLQRYQSALPTAMAREILADELLDVEAVTAFLQAPGG